jgi:hypothetical protein
MADGPDGIDLMRSRIQRGRRTPPSVRGAAPPSDTAVTAPDDAEVGETNLAPPAAARQPKTPRPTMTSAKRWRPEVAHGAATANLALRVRQPLDDHLAEIVHEFRREGVRTSKVELVEMLLWELPQTHTQLRARLAEFRNAAARGGDAPLVGDRGTHRP